MISLKSKITQKVLGYFYLNPHESLHVNELARRLDLDKRNLVKKLRELEQIGILKSESKANLKIYSINREFSLHREYQRIVLGTIGIEGRLRRIIMETRGIKEAYIYGSYAQNRMDAHSDIDLLIIGDQEIRSFQKKINLLQREIGREINSVNMSEGEFHRRQESGDPFLLGIFKQKIIRLV